MNVVRFLSNQRGRSRRCGIVHRWFGGLVHRYEPEVKERRMLKLRVKNRTLTADSLRLGRNDVRVVEGAADG